MVSVQVIEIDHRFTLLKSLQRHTAAPKQDDFRPIDQLRGIDVVHHPNIFWKIVVAISITSMRFDQDIVIFELGNEVKRSQIFIPKSIALAVRWQYKQPVTP